MTAADDDTKGAIDPEDGHCPETDPSASQEASDGSVTAARPTRPASGTGTGLEVGYVDSAGAGGSPDLSVHQPPLPSRDLCHSSVVEKT
jgi:hypothetical protein